MDNNLCSTEGPFGVTDHMDRSQGLLSSPSFVPHFVRVLNIISSEHNTNTSQNDELLFQMLPYTDHMSFTERWHSTMVTIYDWILRNVVHLPSERAFANKYFAHLGPLPSLDDIIRNVSLVLSNTHRAISSPRPSMPSIPSVQPLTKFLI